MTEKDYSGTTTSKISKNAKSSSAIKMQPSKVIKKDEKFVKTEKSDSTGEESDYIKAGQIAKEVKIYASSIIKPGVLLIEIANKIEEKIIELGGKIAFPVNLSTEDIAAHYTPSYNDTKKAEGLLKIDIGVHIQGCVCDIAFSMDLTPEKKYSKLIESSKNALNSALEVLKEKKSKVSFNEIGEKIQKEIQKLNFSPIRNLSGHSLSKFQIHSGETIPNYANGNIKQISNGAFAIEPFATTGSGIVYEGSGSGIYKITRLQQPRDQNSREILNYITTEKETLPFSQRELVKKFGTRALFSIQNLKKAGIIEEYPMLIEQEHKPVSQAETSVLITENKVHILCE
jgi:methionyl aminopeptidase